MSLTSVIRYTKALDTAATDGSGKTGLAFSDVTAKYLVQGGTLTSLTPETITTLGTYQAPTDAAHIRIKELSSSDPCKGDYEIHFHNTQVASSGLKLWLFLSASGAAFQPFELDLSDLSGRLPAALTGSGNIKADALAVNGVATTSVTTVNANVGTTQPTNFTGTGGSALVKGDTLSMAGATLYDSDFTIASATSTALTLPTTYTNTAALPDDARYAQVVLQVVAGTGTDQIILLGAKSGVRTFDVFSGMPVTLDNTSKCVVLGTWKSDMEAVLGNATGLTGFERAIRGISVGTVGVGSTTLNIVTSAFSPTIVDNSQLVGKVIVFPKDTTTGGLRSQAATISAVTTGATPTLTVSNALTSAPASGDFFTIQ